MITDPLRYLIDRPWRDVVLPPDAVGIPTMLSKAERRLLYTLARDFATGEGAIVDAGCFLGGSSAALLAGVRDRSEPWTGPPVESYDLFRVEDFTIPKFFRDAGVRAGDSFRPRYDAHVSRFDVPHVVHEGDITELGRVLTEKFGWDAARAEEAVEQLIRIADVVDPEATVTEITADPADNRVLEAAAEGGADAIVSGDRHLLALESWRDMPIRSPSAFVAGVP